MAQLKLITSIIITFYICVVEGTERQCDSVKDQQLLLYVIGIYSACYNQTNRTEINQFAEDLDKTVKYMWNFQNSLMKNNATYISIDVCDKFDSLPDIVQSIYLDKRYHFKSWSKMRNKTYYLSNILAIYAEGPPEMMDYLNASFYGDYRFTGREASYNSPVDIELFDIYATALRYIITRRLKWERLLILNVQPSDMTFLYKFLTSKAIESELCVQFKEVDRSWNISQDNYFNEIWFKENKPAVITIGDKFGQVEIIKQLTKLMGNYNITIPILAEGFFDDIRILKSKFNNFDCFKGINDSFITTVNFIFNLAEQNFVDDIDRQMFDEMVTSKLTKKVPTQRQRLFLSDSMYMYHGYNFVCDCLFYDCMVEEINRSILRRDRSRSFF